MANTRKIVKRRKTVNNICKITKTMEMIATSRFKKASNRASSNRLYTEQLEHLYGILIRHASEIDHPLLQENSDLLPTIVLVVSSNRGLCGGYNGNLLKEAARQINLLRYESHTIDLHVSGKKGINFFKFKNEPINRAYTEYDYQTTWHDINKIASDYVEQYQAGEIRGVKVVYTRFVSSARFTPEIISLLPVVPEEIAGNTPTGDYLFAPNPQEIADELIPASVSTRLFQCFADSIASEQVARMRSMKAATDNAGQMIQDLTATYNRLRQGQITGELLDIIGGVEAIK